MAAASMASETLSVVADRGYFKSEQILACRDDDQIAVTTLVLNRE